MPKLNNPKYHKVSSEMYLLKTIQSLVLYTLFFALFVLSIFTEAMTCVRIGLWASACYFANEAYDPYKTMRYHRKMYVALKAHEELEGGSK